MRLKRILGVLLVAVGIILTILIAFLGSKDSPPSAQTQAILALLAIAAQIGASAIFGSLGRADPTMAERVVSRLFSLSLRTEKARRGVEELHENKPPIDILQDSIGQLSVTLSVLEEGYVQAIEDWKIFHPRAVEKAQLNFNNNSGGQDDE